MSDQKLIDIGHISEHLGVKVNTVYSWVNQRKIPYVKVGRLIKFDLQDINQWIAERKITAKDF